MAFEAYDVCNRQLKRFEQHKHSVGQSLLKLVELIELRVEGDLAIAILSLVLVLVLLMILILLSMLILVGLFPLPSSVLFASRLVSLTRTITIIGGRLVRFIIVHLLIAALFVRLRSPVREDPLALQHLREVVRVQASADRVEEGRVGVDGGRDRRCCCGCRFFGGRRHGWRQGRR